MLIDHQNIQDLKTEQVHQVLCSPWPFPLMIHLKKKTPFTECHFPFSFSLYHSDSQSSIDCLLLDWTIRPILIFSPLFSFHKNSSNRWCCCDHHILLLYQLQNLYTQQSYYQKSHIHTHKFYQKKKSTFWFLFLQNHIQTDCMFHLKKCF